MNTVDGRPSVIALATASMLWIAACDREASRLPVPRSRAASHSIQATEVSRSTRAVEAATAVPLAAFPGAQGGGAASVGGRGGAVYKVTSLADAGPGTLRDCAEVKSGPRTCIFMVGGVIELRTPLYIARPFLTVAGQTAPGGGILITRANDAPPITNFVVIATNDVIWQYTRLRGRYMRECDAIAMGTSTIECGALFRMSGRSYNVIADHNSLSWNLDEAYGVWRGDASPVHHVTMSMSLIAEGHVSHSTGMLAGASTSALGSTVTDIDAHHNLMMNDNHRNPLFKNKSARIVNNVFYNNRFYASQVGGGGRFDVIGNVYKRGPMTGTALFEIQAFSSQGANAVDGEPSLYVSANLGWHGDPTSDQWLLTNRVSGENGSQTGAVPSAWKRTTPLDAMVDIVPLAHPILADSAERVAAMNGTVVPTVGASRRLGCNGYWAANRDAVDLRLIEQYRTNTGITAPPSTFENIPAIAAGTPCADSDNDGMPDLWEMARFGNLAQTAQGDLNGNGYTNLEEYLHGKRWPIKVQ